MSNLCSTFFVVELNPGLICAIFPQLTWAFPFPKIFWRFQVRESLLVRASGLVTADFQTASHARHFRWAVSRIFVLEALPKGIQIEGTFGGPGAGTHKGRFVDTGFFPSVSTSSPSGRRSGFDFLLDEPMLALIRGH